MSILEKIQEHKVIILVIVVCIIIAIAAFSLKGECFTPPVSSNDTFVENFPTAAQNVLVSDANGNLTATSDLGLQNLTVSGESRMGDIISNGNRIAANVGANWGMLWGDECALIGKKGARVRFGVADDIAASKWQEYANFDTAGNFNANRAINANYDINVSADRPEGGRISIQNPSKKKKEQTSNWAIWNMTGGYGDRLSFWRYNGSGGAAGSVTESINAASALDLYDNGEVVVPGSVLKVGGRNILAELDALKASIADLNSNSLKKNTLYNTTTRQGNGVGIGNAAMLRACNYHDQGCIDSTTLKFT